MQDSVEQQLLTCQEMFQEIEQKVASLSPPPQGDQSQVDELGAVGAQQEVAELLSSKLQQLKLNLVSFQQLLQDRQVEDMGTSSEEPQQQKSTPLAERHPVCKLQRSSSVQELFSSPRNKLLRQSSLQQQKELEHELTEQKGLTQAIIRHSSRASLWSAPAGPDVEEDSAQKKWDHLHSRLLAVEESRPLPPSEVTDSSVWQTDGTAGCMIGAQKLKELQTHISLLRDLGRKAAETSSLTSGDGSHQELDEGLFHVLYGASLSVSSINNLLHSPAGTTHEADARLRLQQLQALTEELATLGSELASQGSEVCGVLGSERGQRCVDVLSRILPVVQAAVTSREQQLRDREQEMLTQQRTLRELHAAFTSNQSTFQQMINDFNRSSNEQLQGVVQMQQRLQQQLQQVDSLLQPPGPQLPPSPIQQATRLQMELEATLGGVGSHHEDQRSSVELQQQYERLVHSFKELLNLGSDHLRREPELQSRAGLQQQLSRHTKCLQLLGHHSRTLQYITRRLHESSLQQWEGEVTGLQQEVTRLEHRGLEKGASMKKTLQMWSQWDEERSWSDSLLRGIDTSFPRMQGEGGSEERILLHQELGFTLEQNKARFSRALEAGLRLQKLGCRSVGDSRTQLETRWRSLHERVEHERNVCDRKKKLSSRFLQDFTALTDWMGGARELIDRWNQPSVSVGEELDRERRRDQYLQIVAFTKELEPKSELKVRVIGAGSRLVQIGEDPERSLEDEAAALLQTSDLDPCSFSFQLRQLELDWSSLLGDVAAVQDALHKRWVKVLTQQGALLQLQSWLRAAESQLEEHCSRRRQTSTKADLTQLLKFCKECQVEMSAHQATLDYVNQPLQDCGTEEGQGGRYTQNQFAEDQGCFNHQWLSLQGKICSQVTEVEQDLRDGAELEARLTQINSWISRQKLWLSSAQTPSSQTELQRSLHTCQDLGGKIQETSAALLKLRHRLCDDQGKNICDFISQTETTIEACAALTQQNEAVKLRLDQAQQLWDSVEKKLNHLLQETLRASQAADYYSSSQLSLQAQRELHHRLQLLHEEAEALEEQWDELTPTISSLKELISPAAADLVAEQLERQRDSWAAASGALAQQLQRSQVLLQLWEVYDRPAASLTQRLQTLQSDVTSALSPDPDEDAVEQIAASIREVQSLLERTDALHSDLQGGLEASKDLNERLDSTAACLLQSGSRLLSRSVLQLRHMLHRKLGRLKEELERLQEFGDVQESLQRSLELWQQRLQDASPGAEQSDLLEPCGLSADLEVLNEMSCSLPLGGAAASCLRRLNQGWADTSTRAEEACSELQSEALRQQSFQQKCESWMWFLQRMEDSLAVDVAGSYTGLRQQLRSHKRFQAELSVGHQILHSVVTEALRLLQRGEVEDRSDFVLKLAQLREHWQGAVQRAEQRRSLVEGLVKQWHLYRRSLTKLQKFLDDTNALLPPGPEPRSLQELRQTRQNLLHTELMFQRYQCSFIQTLEVGRQLFSMGDEETQTQLQKDLGALQEEWDHLHTLLEHRIDLTETILKTWESCEAGLADSMMQLKDLKTRLNESMPDCDDEMHSTKKSKENEDSLEDWAESLTELRTMKTDLSQYIITDDVLLLQEQVEQLHYQWEELCFKVSLRRQEIADRLNAWVIFNEKNKELCEWLTQMENKVAHSSDLSIEEMVEKLKKDCMEEINLFSENKTHLKQLGEQLITASNKTKEAEVNDKLNDANDRWQHLFDHIETRVRKLKETLGTVQLLDKNMSNLRTWLTRIEAELSRPVVYDVCHSDEIQKKLAEQQVLQRDIEQHSESVASVLTLCDVLLHDADACDSDSENDSIQQTTRSLDRRWRNICSMSMERRMRIEETWRLWCKFLDDYSRFEVWLKAAELTAANPDSSHVLYTSAKEELKKFEAFQRQVHERLTQLELVNKQYRRLARENRTDAASKLKVMVQEGNHRWDGLQRRVAAVLRRLKHFTSQREDFEGTREGILVWLTEMDLQLTNVEHFSESDVEDKMSELNGFQQEITLNTNKIDALIVFGENLIQKSAPLDAVLIEDELEELHAYCQEVFGRVARFHHRLVSRRPVLEEDVAAAGRQNACHLLAPPLERSGRETPVSVDSIPLEWDHTVDVGGSSSHEDDDEDVSFFSALSVKSMSDLPSWHQPGSPEENPVPGLRPSPTHSTPQIHRQGYVKLMSECSSSIDSVRRVQLILNDDEELDDVGLSSTADKHASTGVIERWEMLQAQADSGVQEDLEQWQKLNSDLCDVTSWLGRVLPEVQQLQRIPSSSSIQDIEVNIQKLKEMQKTFNSYKCLMISVNLSSRHFLQGDSTETQELQEALSSANHSWTQACSSLESWERRLHAALMQCQEFHETLHALLLWLSQAESRLHSVKTRNLLSSRSAALECRNTLMALQEDLMRRQQQATSLQEISSQLLLEATGEESLEAKEKVHVIGNKLRLLLRTVAADLRTLQRETCSTSCEMDSIGLGTLITEESGPQTAAVRQASTRREERRSSSQRRPFFHRVLRAAFPLHLLFLVLLVLACLVPLSEKDYSCALSNNFARSFYPMLRYTNGPPPT